MEMRLQIEKSRNGFGQIFFFSWGKKSSMELLCLGAKYLGIVLPALF